MATDLAGAIVTDPDGTGRCSARSAAAVISHLSGDDAGAVRDAGAGPIPS